MITETLERLRQAMDSAGVTLLADVQLLVQLRDASLRRGGLEGWTPWEASLGYGRLRRLGLTEGRRWPLPIPQRALGRRGGRRMEFQARLTQRGRDFLLAARL